MSLTRDEHTALINRLVYKVGMVAIEKGFYDGDYDEQLAEVERLLDECLPPEKVTP